MTSPNGPLSVRTRGARRLTRATVAMVVLGVGAVAGLAMHDAEQAHATSRGTTTSTNGVTDDNGSVFGDGSTSSSTVTTTESPPLATSGGS